MDEFVKAVKVMMEEPTETVDLNSWEHMDSVDQHLGSLHGTHLSSLHVCVAAVWLGLFVRLLVARSAPVSGV